MTETSATKPPQLRAARARKQSIIKFVILFVTLAFLFVPLLAMLIFTLRHPLSGRWSAAPWIAIFTGNGESLGADLTVLWQGIGTSLALSAVTVVIMLVLLVPTMVIVHIRSKVLERAIEWVATLPLTIPAIVLSCVALMLAAAVLAALLTKALVQPVLNMTEDLDHIQENVPYRELIPFAESIHSDRILRENNEKMRQEFTANVSHELKTPLTSISGYAELIETGIAKPEDVPDFGRKIHSEATRMIQLVNDILQLSKLDTVSETGDTPVMETIDLLEVAKECVERQKLNARRAYISLTYLGESAPVLGSRALLDELCQNLCDNAIRYNRPGGKVQIITTCNRDGHCSLTVTDNGIGIPREAQASVFERFYRVDKSRSKATGGTGLGLAIVKHIARIHNARIKLESQVDVGTTITVTFPTAS